MATTTQYVNKTEFNKLEKKVEKLEEEFDNSRELIQGIDKKVDIIVEKVGSSKEIEDLKMQPLIDRVTRLEQENQAIKDRSKATWNTVIGNTIGLVFSIVGAIIMIALKLK